MTCSRNISLYSSPSCLEESGVLCWPMCFLAHFCPGSFWCDLCHWGYHLCCGFLPCTTTWVETTDSFSFSLTADCCQGWPHLHLGFTGERLPGKCWDRDGLFPTRMFQPGCLNSFGLNQPEPYLFIRSQEVMTANYFCPKWTGISNLKSWMAIEKRT